MSNQSLTPPAELLEAGQKLAKNTFVAGKKEEIKRRLQGAYVCGVLIYAAQREGFKNTIDEEGGIKSISSMFSGANKIETNSGRLLYLSDILQTPTIPIDLGDKRELCIEDEVFQQRYEIGLGFGGLVNGLGPEASAYDLDFRMPQSPRNPFSIILDDESYFPEKIGLTETLTVSNGDESTVLKSHCYTFGRVWSPNLFGVTPAPDPYHSPLEYRRWALSQDNRLLELGFVASQGIDHGNGATMSVLLTKHGAIKDGHKAMDVYKSVGRFSTLVQYYGSRLCPGLFDVDENVFWSAREQIPALPATDTE